MKTEILEGLAGIKEHLDERARELNAELVEVMNMWNGVCDLMNGHSSATVARLAGKKKTGKKKAVASSPASKPAEVVSVKAKASKTRTRNGKPTNYERLVVLLSSGKKFTPATVAKKLKIDANYACTMLRQAVKDGAAANPERGVYLGHATTAAG